MYTHYLNIKPADINKNIKKIRKLWLMLSRQNKVLTINSLNPLESLILINKESTKSGFTPIGLTLQFSIDIGCNANCIMCDKRIKKKKSNQTYNRLTKLLDYIDKNTISNIKLLGGEPLLDKSGLLSFIKKCSARSFKMTLITNGSLLTRQYLDLIIKNGLDRITISLDSHKPKKHDAIRGLPGLFDSILEVIKYSKSEHPNFRVGINSVIMKGNLDSIRGIIKLVNYLNVDSLNFIYPEDFGKNYNAIKLSESDIRKINNIRNVQGAKKSKAKISWDICNPRLRPGCRFRFTQVTVDEDGELVLCGRYPLKRRYIFNKPLDILLKGNELMRFYTEDDLHCGIGDRDIII